MHPFAVFSPYQYCEHIKSGKVRIRRARTDIDSNQKSMSFCVISIKFKDNPKVIALGSVPSVWLGNRGGKLA